MFFPDRNPLGKASGTTAVKAGTLLSWVLLVPGMVAGLMAGAHFDEIVATKPSIDPWLPTAPMEKADRKSLRPGPSALQTANKEF